jgi:hypothetical protein
MHLAFHGLSRPPVLNWPLVAVARLASTMMPAAALLVLAGALDGPARTACWVAAIAVDYGGLLVRGVEGWRITPGHFAERHGLVIIIALGESIVSLGVGADRLALDLGVIAASLFGLGGRGRPVVGLLRRRGDRRRAATPPRWRGRAGIDRARLLHPTCTCRWWPASSCSRSASSAP